NAAVTVNVVDYNLGNESHASGNVNKGASIQETFDVTSANNYAGNLTLSCGSLPANTTCSFTGANGTGSGPYTLALAAGATSTVTVTISTTTSATAATTAITFKVDATTPSARSKTLPYSLTINSAIANADLSIVGNQSPANPVASGNV